MRGSTRSSTRSTTRRGWGSKILSSWSGVCGSGCGNHQQVWARRDQCERKAVEQSEFWPQSDVKFCHSYCCYCCHLCWHVILMLLLLLLFLLCIFSWKSFNLIYLHWHIHLYWLFAGLSDIEYMMSLLTVLWGQEGLVRYMMSDDNAPVLMDRLDLYQDMDQPLCKWGSSMFWCFSKYLWQNVLVEENETTENSAMVTLICCQDHMLA